MRLDTLPSEPFADPTEHMAAEFRWLDARIADHLRLLRKEGRFDESAMRGLRLEERHVLAGLSSARRPGEIPLDRLRDIIDQRAAAGDLPPLYRIAGRFGLTPFERLALLVAAAPALDHRYRAAVALAQNDATRHAATPDLLIELLDPADRLDRLACFTPDAPLFRHRLLDFVTARSDQPLADRPLAVDDRMVMAMLGKADGLPRRLTAALEKLDPAVEDWAPDLIDHPDIAKPVWLFDCAYDSGQRVLAARRARMANCELLHLDFRQLSIAGSEDLEGLLAMAVREAQLVDGLLFVEMGFADCPSNLLPLLADLARAACPLVVSAPVPVIHGIWEADPTRCEKVTLPPLDAIDRLAWWHRAADDPSDPRITHMAWRSRLGPSGIGRMRRDQSPTRYLAERPLPAMLRQVDSHWRREDLVLSDVLARQLEELTAFVSHWPKVLGDWGYAQSHPQSRHCLALFSGPSGTGKTMAASIVAAEAGLPLFRASLASIFDKYIGETEKQIDRMFEAAAGAGIALLCDEADALFAARSEGTDVHARYANLTVAYLLQRIEDHEGLVILTSNLPRNMDQAFARRIGHSLAFTLPDASGRLKLWRRAIPDRAQLCPDVDFVSLADTFELSGGDIRNASLAAAYLAAAAAEPISMKHLLRAIERELEKAGRTPIAADFGRLGTAR